MAESGSASIKPSGSASTLEASPAATCKPTAQAGRLAGLDRLAARSKPVGIRADDDENLYDVEFTSRFKKDARRAERQGRDMALLRRVVAMLSLGEPLPCEFRDHPLKGKLAFS